jgi:hypothetical protein
MRAQMLNPGAALIETEWTSYTTDEKPPPLASRLELRGLVFALSRNRASDRSVVASSRGSPHVARQYLPR